MASSIKETLKTYLGRIKAITGNVTIAGFLRDTMRLPYARIYLLVAVGCVALFLVVTFPYDMLIRNKLKKMENMLYRSIYIGELSFSVIDSIMANNVIIIMNGGGELSIKMADINLSVNPVTLLMKKDIRCDYQFTSLKYKGDKNRFDCNVNGNLFLDFKSFEDFPASGTISIMTQNLSIKLNEVNLPESSGMGPIQLPLIFIKAMNITGDLNGRKLTLRNMQIGGKDLRGTVSGTVDIERMFGNSRLNLKIAIDSNSAMISDFKGLLSRYMDSKNMIIIPLKGTFSNPRFDFENRESGRSPMQGPGEGGRAPMKFPGGKDPGGDTSGRTPPPE